MSTRILEKGQAGENLSALRKMTANHGFYGLEEGSELCKRKKNAERRERRGKKDYATFCLYISNFEQQKPLAPGSQRS